MHVLETGRPTPIVQNQIYALPAYKVKLFSDVVAATFFQSNTDVFTVSVAVTLDALGQAELAGGFIRCTSATPVVVTLKRD